QPEAIFQSQSRQILRTTGASARVELYTYYTALKLLRKIDAQRPGPAPYIQNIQRTRQGETFITVCKQLCQTKFIAAKRIGLQLVCPVSGPEIRNHTDPPSQI